MLCVPEVIVRRTQSSASVAVAVCATLAGCGREPAADWIVVAPRIYTLAGAPPATVDAEPFVTALAVRDGIILASGDLPSLRRYAGAHTHIEELHDACIFPGWIDSHVHLANLGRLLREVDLVGTRSWQEVTARVAAAAAQVPAGTWISGRGWDQNDWREAAFPDHAALSAAVPDHPVALTRVDGHALVANAAALAIAGIDTRTPDPDGGRVVRDADGRATGVLVDMAMLLVRAHIPAPDAAERQTRLRLALAHASRAGLTMVHDAGLGVEDVADVTVLEAAGQLPVRVYGMWDATPDGDPMAYAAALRAGPRPFVPGSRFGLRCVKLAVDGALGSRGAALLAPYADAPGESGLPQYTLDTLVARARPLHAAGFQLATHAIGDAANRMVLDAYERIQREVPRSDPRHRIEHAQVLAPSDIPRFAALGVLASMQPTHCTSDMPWAGARLGAERIAGAYAWRSLRDTGIPIAAGSDAPVERIEPLDGIYAAVTRRSIGAGPEAGWAPEQRLTRSEALRAFTAWAAAAAFAESWAGTLEPGKRADLVIVDRDLLRCRDDEIRTARVLRAVVDGRDALAPGLAARESTRQRAVQIPSH